MSLSEDGGCHFILSTEFMHPKACLRMGKMMMELLNNMLQTSWQLVTQGNGHYNAHLGQGKDGDDDEVTKYNVTDILSNR